MEVAMTSFTLNGKSVAVDDDPSTPLLRVIRDSLGLTGTKFGCGMALCGACTVHLDGHAIRSCVAPLSRVAGKHVTTIEGLSTDGSHPVQRALRARTRRRYTRTCCGTSGSIRPQRVRAHCTRRYGHRHCQSL